MTPLDRAALADAVEWVEGMRIGPLDAFAFRDEVLDKLREAK